MNKKNLWQKLGVFILFIACNSTNDDLISLPAIDNYYFYNNKEVAFVSENQLFSSGSSSLVPNLVDRTEANDYFVFYHEHRNPIHYNPNFFNTTNNFKLFDYKFFIEITNFNITTNELAYTNSDLTDVHFYYYEVLNASQSANQKIVDNASLYFKKINEEEWQVSVNYQNINYKQNFIKKQ